MNEATGRGIGRRGSKVFWPPAVAYCERRALRWQGRPLRARADAARRSRGDGRPKRGLVPSLWFIFLVRQALAELNSTRTLEFSSSATHSVRPSSRRREKMNRGC